LKRFRSFFYVALIATLAATVGHGRVFIRWQGRSDVVGNLRRLGGRLAYETTIRINGGDGQLSVLSFDDALDTATDQIHRILSLPKRAGGSGGSSLHLIQGDTTTTRLLLLRMEEAGNTLAIIIEQSNADFAASETPTSEHQLKAIPPYPGSSPVFFAEDADTKLRVAVSETLAHGDSVRQFYDRELKARGWMPALKGAENGNLGLPLYIRRSQLCCLSISPARNSTAQRVTVLHKELGNMNALE